jgi:peptidoglycan/LPS O-acetylase OafA/YrhL
MSLAAEKWEIKSSTGSHFDALDGLRGMAILMVCVAHTFYTNSNPDAGSASKYLSRLIDTGGFGVSIFFVLSGFLISYPIFSERRKNPKAWFNRNYVRRRVGKIAPPFYLSLAILVPVYWICLSDPSYLLAGLEWATGLANFIRPAAEIYATYWSLLVEVQFYILLPILFLSLRNVPVKRTTAVIFTVLIVVPFVIRLLSWPGVAVTTREFDFLIRRFPCSLDYFAWGILFAALFVHRSPWPKRTCASLGYLGILLLSATCFVQAYLASFYNLTSDRNFWFAELMRLLPGISTFLMLFFVFAPDSAGARFFSSGPLRFTGIVSYEWFLFHLPVVHYFSQKIPLTHGSVGLYLFKTALPLFATFVFSAVVYRYFSLPIRRWALSAKAKLPEATSVFASQS